VSYKPTYGELIAILRKDYLNDVADADYIREEDYTWSNGFLLRSLQEAERQVCIRKQDAIYDETTAAVCNPTVTADSRVMEIDSRIIDIRWMMIGDRVVKKTTRERLDQDDPSWRSSTNQNYPTRFFVYGNTVYWDILPSVSAAAETCQVGVWRYPLAEGDYEESPEIPYTRDLLWWVLHECYQKSDIDVSETESRQKAKDYLDRFNGAYGLPMSKSALEAKKESPRAFSYSGPNYFGNMTRRGRRL